MNTALDISAATGKDLETVTLALGKAYNGSTAALTKLDPSLKGVIDSESSMQEITEALATSFGGAATTAAMSFEGRMAGMKIAMDETKESIGMALLPVLQKLLELLEPMAEWAQENTTTFLIIAGVIGGFAAAIVVANVAIKAWTIATQIATGAQAAFNFVMSANPIALVILGIVAFVAALVVLYKKFDVVRETVDAVFSFIKDGVTASLDFLKDYISGVLNIYRSIFNAIAKLWNSTIGKLAFKFPDWVPGFGGKGFEVPKIPMLAEGGIVTSPTLALIGEKGPEAVVPLGRGNGMGNVTVNVTGGLSTSAEIGQAVVNAIRAYNRSAGPAQIQVA
jgi:hypothetical protein